jgi:hypothetical protein
LAAIIMNNRTQHRIVSDVPATRPPGRQRRYPMTPARRDRMRHWVILIPAIVIAFGLFIWFVVLPLSR